MKSLDSSNPTITPEAMNDLQSAGVISDLCVNPEDIATVDVDRAVAWLNEKYGTRKQAELFV